jgi:hypothetical protein
MDIRVYKIGICPYFYGGETLSPLSEKEKQNIKKYIYSFKFRTIFLATKINTKLSYQRQCYYGILL